MAKHTKKIHNIYFRASLKNRIDDHIVALQDMRVMLGKHRDELYKLMRKNRLTPADQGKIYSALNCLAALSNNAEANACENTLYMLGLNYNG